VRKILLGVLALAVCVGMFLPDDSFTEDKTTVRLARALYALAGNDTYEAKLALGTLIMNRVESPWFPETLEGVLSQQQQFPTGKKYDRESLAAAHDVISGIRTLDKSAVYYRMTDSENKWNAAPVAVRGNIAFYEVNENR